MDGSRRHVPDSTAARLGLGSSRVVGKHTAGWLSRDSLQPGQAELAATKRDRKEKEVTGHSGSGSEFYI
jgi:hypothetical protein